MEEEFEGLLKINVEELSMMEAKKLLIYIRNSALDETRKIKEGLKEIEKSLSFYYKRKNIIEKLKGNTPLNYIKQQMKDSVFFRQLLFFIFAATISLSLLAIPSLVLFLLNVFFREKLLEKRLEFLTNSNKENLECRDKLVEALKNSEPFLDAIFNKILDMNSYKTVLPEKIGINDISISKNGNKNNLKELKKELTQNYKVAETTPKVKSFSIK
jgi:hypothetical protein